MWRPFAMTLSKRLLSESVTTREAVNALAGRTLVVEVNELPSPIAIGFHQGYIAFPSSPVRIDLRITASVQDLHALATSSDLMQTLKERPVRIEGDTGMLLSLQDLFADLDLSVTPLLVPVLGHSGAQAVALACQGLQQAVTGALASQQRQATDWFVWESSLMASRPELAAVTAQTEALAADIAKLRRAIEKLEHQ